MSKIKKIIESFYFVAIILEMMGFIISISLLKTSSDNVVLLLLPFIILSSLSVILVTFYFVNRVNNLTLVKMHISEKTYWFDFYHIVLYIIHIIFNAICIFVYMKTFYLWLIIFSIILSLIIFSASLILFFKSTFNINKELQERRGRGKDE